MIEEATAVSNGNGGSHEDAELTPAQLKRRALEEARARKLEERVARDKALEDERAVADLEAVERAEAEHGEIGVALGEIKTPLGVVIIKKPKLHEWRRYQDSKMNVSDQETLVSTCIVHPDLKSFRQMVSDYPALGNAAANMVVRLAGGQMALDLIPK